MRQSKNDPISGYRADYSPLMEKLRERKMRRHRLVTLLNLNNQTMTQIGKGLPISMKILIKLCLYFDCEPSEIILVKDANKPKETEEMQS